VDHEQLMRRAIELSRAKMHEADGGPFAAVVAKDGEIVGEGWNQVTSAGDPTAHAEIVAIRAACEALDTFDLSGAAIYSTCEPCPMCLAAIYWARIDELYYANTTQDAAAIGFDDAAIYEQVALPASERELRAERLCAREAHEVFEEWAAMPDKTMY